MSPEDLIVAQEIVQKQVEQVEERERDAPPSIGRELPAPVILPQTGAELK